MPISLSRLGSSARRSVEVNTFQPQIFNPTDPAAWSELVALAEAPATCVVDTLDEQIAELVRTRAPHQRLSDQDVEQRRHALLGGEPADRFGVWVYYPWNYRLIHVLPCEMHRELRLNRNRHKITAQEQNLLLTRRIGIAGLSVGRAVVSTLAREGIGGEFALADFDTLSLSNLNRLVGSLGEIGLNKAVLAARELAELDPFVRVHVFVNGLNDDTMAAFMERVDVVIDECDDLAMKIALREEARRRRLPVVMATSDRGMLDVERFDRQPERPVFHGLLPGITADSVRGLPTKEKIPYVLRIFGAERLEPRMKASLVEINETLSTWPQLASGVALGGALVTDVVRRMLLDEFLDSGRFECDLSTLVKAGSQIELPTLRPFHPDVVCRGDQLSMPPLPPSEGRGAPSHEEFAFVVACGTAAPSGGNMQPWRFEASGYELRAYLDQERSKSRLNFRDRAGYLALGAALHNVLVATQHLGFRAHVDHATSNTGWAWRVTLERTGGCGENRQALEMLFRRCTNRHHEPDHTLTVDELAPLVAAGRPLTLAVVEKGEATTTLASAMADLDRLRFLSPSLHREIFSELRLDAEEARRRGDGIDVASLALSPADLATVALLQSPEAMDFLRRERLGGALGNTSRDAFVSAPALLVASCPATDIASLLRAGSGLQRMWTKATEQGIAVHPWGSPFLFQRLLEEPRSLESWEGESLAQARRAFVQSVAVREGESVMLVFRLSKQGPPTARSLRRNVKDVLTFLEHL